MDSGTYPGCIVVCAPNDGSVMVSDKVTRYLKGGVMVETDATYFYGKTPDG
ncbi:MAG: hypothetical protein VX453_10345 [Acidobacteriota bacterium]|nr:hypothetical protein [Acidobacteriota bacterium]